MLTWNYIKNGTKRKTWPQEPTDCCSPPFYEQAYIELQLQPLCVIEDSGGTAGTGSHVHGSNMLPLDMVQDWGAAGGLGSKTPLPNITKAVRRLSSQASSEATECVKFVFM